MYFLIFSPFFIFLGGAVIATPVLPAFGLFYGPSVNILENPV